MCIALGLCPVHHYKNAMHILKYLLFVYSALLLLLTQLNKTCATIEYQVHGVAGLNHCSKQIQLSFE